MSLWSASWVLEQMRPNDPHIQSLKKKRAQDAKCTTRRELLRLVQTRAVLERLLAKPVSHAVADVLGIMGVAKRPPRAFHDTVRACSSKWGVDGTLCVAVDVLLGDAANPAAVLKHRLTQDQPVQRCRQQAKLADMLQQLEEIDHERTKRTEASRRGHDGKAKAQAWAGDQHHRQRVRQVHDR